jgi:hypothetical protein
MRVAAAPWFLFQEKCLLLEMLWPKKHAFTPQNPFCLLHRISNFHSHSIMAVTA